MNDAVVEALPSRQCNLGLIPGPSILPSPTNLPTLNSNLTLNQNEYATAKSNLLSTIYSFIIKKNNITKGKKITAELNTLLYAYLSFLPYSFLKQRCPLARLFHSVHTHLDFL